MRHFKKRTVALCLASVISVLGAFSDDAFSNNLVDLRINRGSGGRVDLTAYTEKPYTQPIVTERVGNNMYSITFPQAKSSIKKMPDITNCNNIENIQVSTFPTTQSQPGYTRIFIKTINEPSLSAKAALFLEYNDNSAISTISTAPVAKKPKPAPQPKKAESYWDTLNYSQPAQNNASKIQTNNVPPQNEYKAPPKQHKAEAISNDFPVNYHDIPTESTNERWMVILLIAVVLGLVSFIYFLSKDKMASVVGEQNKIDLSDDENETKKKQVKKEKKKSTSGKIRKTINNLDAIYKNRTSSDNINIVSNVTTAKKINEQQENIQDNTESIKETVVVDLDTLFNEKTKEQNQSEIADEHDDLADFLNDFSFDEEIPAEESQVPPFDNELYEKTINNDDVRFTKEDKDRLAVLMRNEISDETINNISEFVPAKPDENKVLSEVTKLENLIAEYTVKQDISFSKDDVDTIKTLMNVEIDDNFIHDLQTNPKRTEQMYQDIENTEKKPHKTSEILTLKVKDFLPDLSKELKKHGNKPIESEAKPDVVYFSEGYEFSKLSVSNDLADISKAIKENKNDFRPSDELPIVEYGYDVKTLSIKDELPDLDDVKANPQKYEDKKTKEKIDEDALLRSISNVKFKPFYENVQNELNQFEGFEVIDNNENDDEIEYKEDNKNTNIIDNIDDEKETTIIDLDKENENNHNTEDDAQKLIKIIEAQQAERQKKEAQSAEQLQQKTEIIEEPIKQESVHTICKIDEKRYDIIKTVSCSDSFNCCLAKGDKGYDVLGQLNGAYQLLKHYDSLRTENIQTRVNEKNVNGSIQYLIRVSIHKFVINVTKNGMEFVMDLC